VTKEEMYGINYGTKEKLYRKKKEGV